MNKLAPLGVGQVEQAAVQVDTKANGHRRPAVGWGKPRRPRTIEGQAEFLRPRTGQFLPPERELARHRAVGDVPFPQQPALPQSVIGVLNGEFDPGGHLAPISRGMGPRQITATAGPATSHPPRCGEEESAGRDALVQ